MLDYQLNIQPAIAGNESDTIESVEVDVNPGNPGDLSVDNILADGCAAIFWMSAGQSGVTYVITVKIGLSSGRAIQRSFLLPVISLSTPPVPANAIQTSYGDMIADQDGNPILSAPIA